MCRFLNALHATTYIAVVTFLLILPKTPSHFFQKKPVNDLIMPQVSTHYRSCQSHTPHKLGIRCPYISAGTCCHRKHKLQRHYPYILACTTRSKHQIRRTDQTLFQSRLLGCVHTVPWSFVPICDVSWIYKKKLKDWVRTNIFQVFGSYTVCQYPICET